MGSFDSFLSFSKLRKRTGAEHEETHEKEVGWEYAPEPEDPEAFPKGHIVLDVAFDEDKTPYVFEIQGRRSGLKGVQELESEDFEKPMDERVRRIAQTWEEFNHKYANPEWFESIADNKALQGDFIPDQNRPPMVVNGNFDHLLKDGPVIIKPSIGLAGRGIRIFTIDQADEAHAYAKKYRNNRYKGLLHSN